jgi:segregation and condensation protein A
MNSETNPDFLVELEHYRGPIDLLLYLVRRNEVEIQTLTLGKLIDQYLEYMDIVRELDIDRVGDFLEIASILVESKIRSILPSTDDDDDSDLNDADPREDLVHRLLLYKDFKDVAIQLEEQSLAWQTRHPRVADDLPPRKVSLGEQPLHEIELWDLVSSFGRILKSNSPALASASILLDETPIQAYMKRIHERLVTGGHLTFSALFEPGMHKSAMVGIFLAILELVRHHNVRTEQVGDHGEIQLFPGENFDEQITIDEVADD